MAEGATEFHIVGGLHPDLPFEYYLDLIRGLKQRFPQVHLKAFTMVEVHYYARLSKLSIRDTLLKMKEAGVDSLPGGGAEIFHPRVRRIICDHKVSGHDVAFDRAHRARNRPALECDHALRARRNARRARRPPDAPARNAGQDARLRDVHSARISSGEYGLAHLPKPTGMDALKTIAVSRLMLDNFDHIKAYWIMLTPRIAQIALRFGANDLDGTVVEEKIYHDAGATTPEHLTRAELERLIRAAGRVPVERDTLYNRVDRASMPPVLPQPRARSTDGFIPAESLSTNN